MPDKKITDLVDGGDPQPTDDFVVARAGDNFKLAWSSLSNAATRNNVALTIAGNTAGAGALVSTGTLTLAGGNNITLSQAGNAITISGGAGGAETQTAISGISASNTLYTSGTVRFTGSQAVTVRSGTGQLVVIDAPAQSTQTQGVLSVGVSTAGNTSGNTTVNTGSRLVFRAEGNITASQVTAAGATTIQLSGSSAQTSNFLSFGVSTGGNTAGNTTVNSGSRLVFAGVGDISLSQATGGGSSTISISGSQSVQTQGVLSAGVSTGGNTSGNTTVNTGSRFVIVGSNGITASQGTAAGATTVTLSGVTQSTQTQGILNAGVSTGGNTSGDTTVNTGTRLVFAGGNNITLSQGTAANATTITISGANVGGAQTGISGLANSQTTYTSGSVTLSELGAITIRSTTGQQFQFSVNPQTTQTQGILSAGISTGGNTAGNTTVNTGSRFVLVASGNATASQATAAGASTVTISVGTQTVQTQDVLSIGVSTGGNTSGNTTVNTGSRFVIVGSNGITASQGTAAGATTVTLSGVTQSVQTQGVPNMGVSTGGNTSGDTTVNSGTRMVFVGTNNITLSQGTAANATTITVSGPTTAAFSGGMSTNGNTSGDTGYATQRLNLIGGNNITLSGSTNAGSMSITISAPNLGAGAFSGGASNLGNTAGATGITGTQLVFVGSDNITLSQTTGANGGTLSIIGGGGGGFSAGMSTEGNTAGNTGVTGTRLVFVGTGPVSLSQTTGAAGGTLSINAPATSSLSATGNIQISTNGSTISIGDGGEVVTFWDNMVPGASTTFVLPNATMHVWPLNPANANFPGYMSVNSIFLDISGTVSTAAAFTRSLSLGFYTITNSTQLSLMASASTSWGTGAGNMNIPDSYGGRRWLTLHSSQFNNSPNFAAGSDYYFAIWERSSGGSQTFTYQGQLLPYNSGVRSGILGAVSSSDTTRGAYPFLGNYSVSFSTAMPNALAAADINKSNATAISLPRLIFNNIGSNIV